jgi:hypothetical protein
LLWWHDDLFNCRIRWLLLHAAQGLPNLAQMSCLNLSRHSSPLYRYVSLIIEHLFLFVNCRAVIFAGTAHATQRQVWSSHSIEIIATITAEAYARYVSLLGRLPQPMTADYSHILAEHPVWLLCLGDQPAGVLVLMTKDFFRA